VSSRTIGPTHRPSALYRLASTSTRVSYSVPRSLPVGSLSSHSPLRRMHIPSWGEPALRWGVRKPSAVKHSPVQPAIDRRNVARQLSGRCASRRGSLIDADLDFERRIRVLCKRSAHVPGDTGNSPSPSLPGFVVDTRRSPCFALTNVVIGMS
jgi:hypothetical protein